MNKIILTGRLCADPELRQTQTNISVCRFRVAVNRPYSKESEKKADFISCTAWRATAEFICKYFTKGSAIIVEGALHNADYTDGAGVKHYAMDVQVSNVEFGESKSASGGQTATTAPTQPQQASNNSAVVDCGIGDLSDFEEILSDGDVPF